MGCVGEVLEEGREATLDDEARAGGDWPPEASRSELWITTVCGDSAEALPPLRAAFEGVALGERGEPATCVP